MEIIPRILCYWTELNGIFLVNRDVLVSFLSYSWNSNRADIIGWRLSDLAIFVGTTCIVVPVIGEDRLTVESRGFLDY